MTGSAITAVRRNCFSSCKNPDYHLLCLKTVSTDGSTVAYRTTVQWQKCIPLPPCRLYSIFTCTLRANLSQCTRKIPRYFGGNIRDDMGRDTCQIFIIHISLSRLNSVKDLNRSLLKWVCVKSKLTMVKWILEAHTKTRTPIAYLTGYPQNLSLGNTYISPSVRSIVPYCTLHKLLLSLFMRNTSSMSRLPSIRRFYIFFNNTPEYVYFYLKPSLPDRRGFIFLAPVQSTSKAFDQIFATPKQCTMHFY